MKNNAKEKDIVMITNREKTEKSEKTQVKRVLIADDDPFVTDLLHHQFNSMGLDATVVDDGEKAEEALKREAFDFVVLDLYMPYRNGLEILKWIAESGNNKEMKVFMLTGQNHEATKKRALSLGADEFFSKPFDPEVVAGAVDRFLNPHAIN